MKATGIVRQLDSLGRIVLPIELRRTMDINAKDLVEIYVEDNLIILKNTIRAASFVTHLPIYIPIWANRSVTNAVPSFKHVPNRVNVRDMLSSRYTQIISILISFFSLITSSIF